MLEYDLNSDKGALEDKDPDESVLASIRPIFNPFPGLRPFSIEECHLFFGRERRVDEVLVKLAENRFVAIMGYSGSGKSSLMYCGLIPVLHGGFMTNAGPNWNILVTRPGAAPIENLAESVLKIDPEHTHKSPDEQRINKNIMTAMLRSNPYGLLEAVNSRAEKQGVRTNTLLLIDQFEEIFGLEEKKSASIVDDASAFVNLIVEACNQPDSDIYIAITMRSDYIGECARFSGLTDKVNMSNYLVPQMTRRQKRMVIEGPVSVGGGVISQRLVKQLLNEIDNNQDQLPILQHALMRTWDYWIQFRERDEPIDIRHYNAVGKISEALSLHADEAYNELTSNQKEIAEILFKSLTEKGLDPLGIRRAVSIGLVAQLAEVTEEEVIEVVEAFRQPGRSFLMPPSMVELDSESQIEIAHESFMRIWTRLKIWVDEEHESAQMYRRLSDAAAMYQVGRTGLWRPPDLQLALNWQKKQKPTRAWAKRYDEAYERAIVFLDTSRITYAAEQKNQEMLQRRLLRRTKVVALILGFAAVIAVLFLIGGYSQWLEANRQRSIAEAESIEAQTQRDEATYQKEIAEQQKEIAEIAQRKAEENEQIAREALEQAEIQRQIAVKNVQIAKTQTLIAEEKRTEAQEQTILAETEFRRAETNYNRAQKLLYQSVAQSMSVKSLGIEDQDLKGVLSKQAYVFNKEYDGRVFDPYIYNSLYDAMASIDGKTYNTIGGLHRNSIRSVVFGKSSTTFYTTGAEGKIVKSSLNGGESIFIYANKHQNRVLKLSHDEKWLVNASDSSYLQVFDIINGTEPQQISGHLSYINDIEFIPRQNKVISVGGDRQVRITDLNTMTSELIRNSTFEFKALSVSPKADYMLGGSLSGAAVLISLSDYSEQVLLESPGNPIHAVAFSKNGDLIATGDERGIIKLMDIKERKVIREYKAHKGRVSDLEFSPNGGLIAAGSFDGTIQMWAMDELDELPIEMTDNDAYIWDIAFSPDSDYLVAACADGEIRTWATDPALMANKICNKLKRNMSQEEWKIYVANDIPFNNTCVNLLLNDY
ncbi:High-affnity carbon uptake protein Hat/HatR [Fulvivirga sp. M361]|uniref:nSTAND1 domain-containing NTPase n=1 Tax=Fulvivirga sp. M361 TaxID=2594266 RepID=UPI00117AB7E5|nr:High-affnity carbon uptake protein Hat/HatR [Fulvivirga sp. M361]TRX48139.1 High-affnity carbon uptake protein Hat/HatR [Fulvivirga sp. M361]